MATAGTSGSGNKACGRRPWCQSAHCHEPGRAKGTSSCPREGLPQGLCLAHTLPGVRPQVQGPTRGHGVALPAENPLQGVGKDGKQGGLGWGHLAGTTAPCTCWPRGSGFHAGCEQVVLPQELQALPSGPKSPLAGCPQHRLTAHTQGKGTHAQPACEQGGCGHLSLAGLWELDTEPSPHPPLEVMDSKGDRPHSQSHKTPLESMWAGGRFSSSEDRGRGRPTPVRPCSCRWARPGTGVSPQTQPSSCRALESALLTPAVI